MRIESSFRIPHFALEGLNGSDWYVWHAPDGLRARAATGLGCVQAGAQKLGVIAASYAAAIIGVQVRGGGRRRIAQAGMPSKMMTIPNRACMRLCGSTSMFPRSRTAAAT